MSTGIPRRFAALNTSSSLFIMPWQRRRRRKLEVEEEAASPCFQALPSLDSLDFFSPERTGRSDPNPNTHTNINRQRAANKTTLVDFFVIGDNLPSVATFRKNLTKAI